MLNQKLQAPNSGVNEHVFLSRTVIACIFFGNDKMINKEEYERLARVLPILKKADPGLLRELQQAAFFMRIPKGRDVFIEGDHVSAIALLISGIVRVYKIGETGREITLYRFGNGESCILTANAILSQTNFPAIASVEKEAEAVMFPADAFREWIRRSDLWREFVFDLLSQRLSTVMALIDEVAFRRMDTRVAALLTERTRMSSLIHVTHQEIAAELGSSREVISRILEDFSAEGIIHSTRGAIEVMDHEALQARSVV
jgi:CRP/FNR family transcriptional regulator, anaerobic regulatory protein